MIAKRAKKLNNKTSKEIISAIFLVMDVKNCEQVVNLVQIALGTRLRVDNNNNTVVQGWIRWLAPNVYRPIEYAKYVKL